MRDIPRVPARIFDDFLQSLEIDEDELELLAKQAGWQQREPRKITAADLLSALCVESIQGDASFNDLSSRLGLATNQKGPSRQGIAKRINLSFLELLKLLLARLISIKIDAAGAPNTEEVLPAYKRILLQDSTVITLPGWLFPQFSGVSNGHQQVCNARVQVVYDVKSSARR